VEAVFPFHARALLEHRNADFLGRARIDRRLVDHDGAGPQVLPDRAGGPEQRAEVRFARISYTMRLMRTPSPQQRQQLYDMARGFEASFPEDRRVAALLAEVATRFDHDPKRKRELLLAAQSAARDEELKARLADDFKRVELLGQAINLRFEPAEGKPVDLSAYHGKVVVLVFFSCWSQPALEAIDKIEKAAAKFPADQVQIFGVSLDTKPEPLEALVRQRNIKWPIICDGKAWESPLVRRLGINALPTVWLLDRDGRLVSLDALDGLSGQVREVSARR
jgi:peroxiredoxin